MWRDQMGIQRAIVWPELGKANQAGIKQIFRHIVGEAAVKIARGIDKGLEMRPDGVHGFGREAEGAENGDGFFHGYPEV
jgi:hypothetical protein